MKDETRNELIEPGKAERSGDVAYDLLIEKPRLVTGELTRAVLQDSFDATRFYSSTEDFQKAFLVPENAQLSQPQRIIAKSIEDILCGRVENTSAADVQFVEQFGRIFFTPVPENSSDGEKAEALSPMKDVRLTNSLKRYLAASVGSPVQSERTKFGISEPEGEKPFDVCVVSIDGPDSAERSAKWAEVSEGSTMFVLNSIYTNGERKLPTIYMSSPQARSILYGASSMDEILALRHEYRHTQRTSSFDEQRRLFQFLDEAMTSIEHQYASTRIALRFLTLVTPDLTREEFLQAHESGDEHAQAECLQKWTKSFGEKGLLLLGASHNAEYPQQILGEFQKLPINADDKTDNPRIAYAETLLALREERDPHWREVFARRLQDPSFTVDGLQFWLDPIFLEFCSGIEKTDSPRLMDMLQIIRDEITRRG